MCNIEISPKATAETIAKAFKKATEQAGNYTLVNHAEYEFYAVRNHKNGESYTVTPCCIFDEVITCNCRAYKADFFCKHCALVINEVQTLAWIAQEEEKAFWLDPGANTDRYAFC